MRKAILVLTILFFAFGTTNAQQGKMAVGGQVAISLPMGDFSDGANMGFGLLGNFFYTINKNIDVTGTIGYLTWGGKGSDNNVEGYSSSVSFNDIPIVVGGRYYLERKKLAPYALAELGLHLFGSSVESSYTNPLTGQPIKQDFDNSTNEFGLGLGGGFLYDMGNMKLDINAKLNIISDFNHITLMAGILFPLK